MASDSSRARGSQRAKLLVRVLTRGRKRCDRGAVVLEKITPQAILQPPGVTAGGPAALGPILSLSLPLSGEVSRSSP